MRSSTAPKFPEGFQVPCRARLLQVLCGNSQISRTPDSKQAVKILAPGFCSSSSWELKAPSGRIPLYSSANYRVLEAEAGVS